MASTSRVSRKRVEDAKIFEVIEESTGKQRVETQNK